MVASRYRGVQYAAACFRFSEWKENTGRRRCRMNHVQDLDLGDSQSCDWDTLFHNEVHLCDLSHEGADKELRWYDCLLGEACVSVGRPCKCLALLYVPRSTLRLTTGRPILCWNHSLEPRSTRIQVATSAYSVLSHTSLHIVLPVLIRVTLLSKQVISPSPVRAVYSF